jgi:hypothetical protein
MIAGIFREDFPWISEVLTEAYREIRDGSPENAGKTLTRLRRMMKHMMMHSKMFYELSGGSKELMMLADELPMILDMARSMIPEKPTLEDQDD